MEQPLAVAARGLRWLAEPHWRDLLLSSNVLPLADWLRDGVAQIVKHGPHRTVYRVALPGLDCHIKQNRLHGPRAWLRELVRPAKAHIEYERAQAVAARGIATFEPLAVGYRPPWAGPGDSFLVSRTLNGTVALDAWIDGVFAHYPSARQTSVRQDVAHELGRFMAQVHQAGVIHRDLHAGNLLLRLDDDGRPCFYLIDLHAVHVGPALAQAQGEANLVLLNRWFALRAGRTDRRRFWESYARAWQPDAPRFDVSVAAAQQEEATWRSNLEFWRKREQRCLKNNRYYRRIKAAGMTGFTVTDLDSATLESLILDPDAPFQRQGTALIKDSPSSTVTAVPVSLGGVSGTAIYKRFRVTSRTEPWLALLRRPAALRSWFFGHSLRERGLPTPRPLLVLYRRRSGLHHEGYLLTEMVPDAIDLRAQVERLGNLPEAERRPALRHGIAGLAKLIRELHHRGLSHRDLKAANILYQPSSGPPTSSGGVRVWLSAFAPFWLIDLVGVRRHTEAPMDRRVQNLARIHTSFRRQAWLTRSDRLRFLRDYLQWGLHGRVGWKPWWRQIDKAAAAKAARNTRRGRPLT